MRKYGKSMFEILSEMNKDLEEFKKMIVTIKDPSKRRKAMDDIKRFGKQSGSSYVIGKKKPFRIDKMRDGKSFKIDGQGADLNKFAIDMKNYYGAEIKAESVEEAKTVGGALAQGHLEKMTDQRFKEFYGMTKDEYIKKHGDPRKEETELTEALNINIVKGMTQRNDHFGARLYIAEQMKDKHMIAIYQGLGLAHDNYNRYVGNSALMVRQKLETVLKGKIVGTYGSAKGAEIIKAL